jgi:DNA polymerase I-like protein with 3'-5' exonuclease and polymerase domains
LTTLVGEVIAIDIEVHEEKELSKYGPGSHRHYLDGDPSHILGVALSDGENDFYYPYSKELFDWLREIQGEYLWVGHNILYDLSWLRYEGFKPQRVADTMGLVRLIHEDRQPRKGHSKPYSLDTCAFDFLGERKNEKEMQEWCHKQGFAGAPQKWLREMPVDMVARYAKKDTRLTFRLYHALIGRIDEQRLNDVWEIEKALLPILSEMHHRGIRIDDSRRQEVSEALSAEISELKETLVGMAGVDFNTNSAKQLAPIFDKLGIPYKHTEKGNPSFKAENLLPYGIDPDPENFAHVLVQHNKLLKLRRDFVDRLEDFMVQGRIHPMINPYGTKTGRPTSNTPNIFQIPKRGRGKKICRTLFLPEEGEEWASLDYASEEYRVFAHYAVGPGSDRYRLKYQMEDDYDLHTENAQLAGVDRTKAKTIGLGVLFGMGKNKMASNLGVDHAEGLRIVDRFHEHNPSFRATAHLVESRAKSRGWIHTIMGRRRRLDYDSAYRGLNFLTQANSADLAKKTIVEAEKKGLWGKMSLLLYLYDEYDISIAPENREYLAVFKQIAETAIKFRVPMKLDVATGPNWGETVDT